MTIVVTKLHRNILPPFSIAYISEELEELFSKRKTEYLASNAAEYIFIADGFLEFI
ncbi:uncharacterized protein PHALS_07448 [Plasmopara halstedii]|uniref:Uncharacterized protein n=1 Tax=Plasmopara halstedii TaxID=4781 RepID=A0A0P1B5T6_PLAHL|nr:uncharacterized protein PHALS_07448 [Plasmopara halstedii]CEG49696.1 hypothetical protein PHALS_07448 [Plasmopara halstedii]|eukprot:XP_024586065.1 hypothetical protein PHALS_07448 [Plasmopara halstedii]